MEEKTLDFLKGALPEILEKVEKEKLEQKETMNRLENDGATQKIEEEKARLEKIASDRQKKIQDFVEKEKLTSGESTNVVLQLVEKRNKEEKATQIECDIYNLLDCSKADMVNVDKLINEKLRDTEGNEETAGDKQKSDAELKKKYL